MLQNKEEGGRNISGKGMAKNVWPCSALFSADLKRKKRVRDKNIKACIVHIPAILHIPTQVSRPADKFVVKDQAYVSFTYPHCNIQKNLILCFLIILAFL